MANTAVVAWAGKLLCLWEQGPPHALDAETLETAAGWDHLNYLETPACAVSRLRPLLAHTRVWVADDGRERLVGLSVVGSHFTFYEFDERGDRVATVSVELPFSNPLTHDFSLTEHYYIVAENPVRYEPDVAGALDGSQPALGPSFLASETGRSGLLALVPRDGSKPIVLDAGDASIVFHYANAWEEGSRIKIAACAFDRYELGAEYGFDAAGGRFDPNLLLRHNNEWGPFLRLSTVDLAARTVTHSTTKVHRDFPRVHPRREGRPTKYAYVAASPDLGDSEPFFPFQCIQKVALDGSGHTLTWKPSKPGCFVGEPVVAPRPGAVEEDDAWLLIVVHDVHAAATDLVVLDARSLAVAAELRVDRLLPLGLHGTWA